MLKPPFGTPEEKNWHVEQQRVISENPWFRLLDSKVRMPDQNHTQYHTLDFKRAAVGIVPRRPNEILLIRQYRFIVDEFVWAIPSGGVEKSEDFVAAARRELVEETGYTANKITKLHNYYASYGCTNQEFHLYLAEEISEEPVPFDRNEVLDIRWFSDDEIKSMLFNNQIVDGLSLSPLLYLFAMERQS